eukprot:TRINITY_DN17_c0_g1_i3.p2 TRINITY_DN17_c0_g1~~TRINITY_DN17_c0_g1_i3.p2  ORF type:complete len:287 (-),score=6.21 TRINITY_DN17_c0_g1_i3:23-883(-)
MLNQASHSSVTLWEEAAPAKLTRKHCPVPSQWDHGQNPNYNRVVFHIATPSKPKSRVHSLPPTLRNRNQNTIPAYSKGAQGLSVLLQAGGIFTAITVSPRTSPRQSSHRYTIRAGRNLPDKEFRYLRTVIVTAAVYRGFDSRLAPLLLTFRHRAGVRPYTSPCGFAEPYVFSKQSLPPGLCHPPLVAQREVPLLPKLRGHFAEFLHHRSLKRLGMLYLPTCVGFGYGPVGGAVSWKSYAAHTIQQACTTIGLRHHRRAGECQPHFPSTTPFGLALGAGSPSADQPC